MSRAAYVTYALDDAGEPISSPTVNVYDPDTTNHIGQTIYVDDSSASSKTNPFTGDADGRIEIFLNSAAAVDIAISKVGYTATTLGAVVNPPLTFGTTSDIADIGTAEAAGATTKVADAGHVHAHPVIVTGGLHTEYMATAAHLSALHNSMGITPGAHAASHAPGGTDEVATGGGGGGSGFSASFGYFIYKSGGNYFCVRTIDNTLIVSNAASVHTAINAADVAQTAGGGIIVQDTSFTTTGTINLTNGNRLCGSRTSVAGSTLNPLISAGSGLGANPVIQLSSTGSGIVGLNVNGAGIANNTIRVLTQEWSANNCFLQGGTLHTLYADPATAGGPARGRFSHLRCDGNNNPSVSVIELNSSDHLGSMLTATGCGTGAAACIVGGQHGQYSSCHFTGDSTSDSALIVTNEGNAFSSVFADCPGSASQGAFLVTGTQNKFSSCGAMNPPLTTKPLITLRQQSAGQNLAGNQFWGSYAVGGAQGGSWNGLVEFKTNTGAVPADLSNFKGTRIVGAGNTMPQRSAGPNYTNMATIPTNMDVGIEWHSTTSGGQYVRPV